MPGVTPETATRKGTGDTMKSIRVILVLLLMATAGCIKVDQTLSLNKDGSGTLAVRYGMSEQTIAQMESMKEMQKNMPDAEGMGEAEDDNPFDFDEEEIRDQFKDLQEEGIELEEVKSEVKDGWKYMNVKFKFDDLNALAKTDFFKGSSLSLSKDADGNYVLVQQSGEMDTGMGPGADAEMDPEMEKQMMMQMAPMFAGMRVAMTIHTPTAIIESNATEQQDDSASWVYDVDKDPESLLKMKNSNFRLVFSGKGVDLPEINIEPEEEPAAE
jgi:hypothetical protein